MPDPLPLDPNNPSYTIDKGHLAALYPPCAKQQLSYLGHWQGHRKQQFPENLLPLRLFKCRQWFWLVVPGLYHADPKILQQNTNTMHYQTDNETEKNQLTNRHQILAKFLRSSKIS